MYVMGQEKVVGMLCQTSRLFILLYRLLTSLGTSYSLHLSHLSLKLTRDPYQQTGGVEREDLGLWHYPVVPGHCPGPLLSDGDGCGLSPFRAMEEVPVRFWEKWSVVIVTILRKLEQSVQFNREGFLKEF